MTASPRAVSSTALRSSRALAAGRRRARHYAMQALYQWAMSGTDLRAIERYFRDEFDFGKVDNEYFVELLHQIPAQLETVDAAYRDALDRRPEELGEVERALLRIGSYEFLQRVDVPYRVVIDEAVALAKKFGATDSYKFINGVLDRVARQLRGAETAAGS